MLSTWHNNAVRVYDEKTPGLFKTEWDGNGIVALSSKTYYYRDSQGQDEFPVRACRRKPKPTAWHLRPTTVSCLQGSPAVVSTVASGLDQVGKCIPIGRRGLPSLPCTLKGVWWTTASTQSRCTCEPHTACLPACLLTNRWYGHLRHHRCWRIWYAWPATAVAFSHVPCWLLLEWQVHAEYSTSGTVL